MDKNPSLKIIHLSDLHFGLPVLSWGNYFSKRLLGYLNLRLNRSQHFADKFRTKLVQQIQRMEWDFLVITGDLTNLSLESEFILARKILEPILKPGKVIIIPGNHDRYVYSAAKEDLIKKHFEDFIVLSWKERSEKGYFTKELNRDTLLVGFDMARPSVPFSARGALTRGTLEGCKEELRNLTKEYSCKIAIGHYPLWLADNVKQGILHQLASIDSLKEFLIEHQFKAYLHGHIHKSWSFSSEATHQIHSINSAGCCRHVTGEWGGFHKIIIEQGSIKTERIYLEV